MERTISNTTASGLSDEQDGTKELKSANETKQLRERNIMDAFSRKRRIELLRRLSEVGLLFGLGFIVYSGNEQRDARLWKTGMS